MAIATTYNFATSRDELIKAALRKIAVLGEGQTPTTQQYTDGAEVLNMMVKAWQAEGMPLWARRYVYLLPITTTNQYLIGPTASTTYHAVTSFSTNTVGTTITSGTSLVLGTSVATTSGDYIGIAMDDNSMFWTTTTTTGTGTNKTLATAVPSTATAANYIYIHTATAFTQKPLKLYSAWRADMASNSRQTPIEIIPFQNINSLLSSDVGSVVTQISYLPSQGSPLSSGTSTATIWPRFSGGRYYLLLDCQYPFADFDSSTDEPDFPQEFFEALVYGLAIRLAPEYGYPLEDRMVLKGEADKIKSNAFDFNQEMASVFIQPARY